MDIQTIKEKLHEQSIYHSEAEILNRHSIVGYEKKFRWSWMATQLNTFIIATDFGSDEIHKTVIENHLSEAFRFSERHYTGWPRGLQSGIGVISILISSSITEEAKEYCLKLKSGKKWAGFTIPVVYDSTTGNIFQFEKNPIWGRIYYPHFKKLINSLK